MPVKNSADSAHTQAPQFVDLDKNFCHCPMARDSRCKASFNRSDQGYTVKLPGEDAFILTVQRPSLLTPFDINFLCYVIALAKTRNSTAVDLKSAKQVLKHLGYSYQAKNIESLNRSLALLTTTSITRTKWYLGKGNGQITRKLPHPSAKSIAG